jgi:hypothetical protein
MKTNGWQMNGGVPPGVNTPRGDQTPSSLGFGSPPADFSGFSPFRDEQKSADIGGSKLDQAYFKLANLDTFSLASKKDEEKVNPFESGSITETRSLAAIAKGTQKTNKEIMRSHALVVSTNPSNNYASQYGITPMQQPMGQPQPQQYGQPQPQQYGQPQPQQFGQPQPQQFGQPQPQQFGQPQPQQFGQQQGQPPNPFGGQQVQYGQPPSQGQQPQYGGHQNTFGAGHPQAQYGQVPYSQQPQQQSQHTQPPPQQMSYGQLQPQGFNPAPPMQQQYGAPQYGRPQVGHQGY